MRHSPIQSISSVSSSSPSGAIAQQLQAQAEQYAANFTTLQKTIEAGDLSGAKKALAVFVKDTNAAAANGFDPVNQNSAVRQNFAAIKTTLASGDMTGAQSAALELKKNLQAAQSGHVTTEVKSVKAAVASGNPAAASDSLAALASDVAMNAVDSTNPMESGVTLSQDIRALQNAFQSGDPKKSQEVFDSVQSDLNMVVQNSPQLKPGTPAPSQFAQTHGVVQSLGTLPTGTDAASAIQAYTMAMQQGIQVAKTDTTATSGYLVKAPSEVQS